MAVRVSRALAFAIATWIVLVAVTAPAAAQTVSVSAADPASGTQDTLGLVVKITGRNFAPGARSDFFLTGTANPGGITVRGTQFVSSTEVDALIDIAPTASIASFDIRVTNTSGRSGKGSDLFHVTEKVTGQVDCTPRTTTEFGAPLVRLNAPTSGGGPMFTDGFGQRIAMGEVVRPNLTRVLVLLVPTRNQAAYVFVLDPVSAAQVQPAQTISLPAVDPTRPFFPQYGTVTGDFNADGVPDFAMANSNPGTVYVLMGRMDPLSGQLTYDATGRYRITTPSGGDSVTFGAGLGAGDVNGGADELVVAGGTGTKVKGSLTGSRVYVYTFTSGGFVLSASLTPSLPSGFQIGEFLGSFGFAVGQIDGQGGGDIALGSSQRDVTGVVDAGQAFVFTGPGLGATPAFTLQSSPLVSGGGFAQRIELLPPLDTMTGTSRNLLVARSGGSDLLAAPIAASGPQPVAAQFAPEAGLDNGWAYYGSGAADVNGDGILDLIIPAHLAQFSSSCGQMGVSYVFLSQGTPSTPTWRRVSLQPPDLSGRRFGTGVALSSGSASVSGLVVVGDTSANVAGVDGAGQVYIYRLQ